MFKKLVATVMCIVLTLLLCGCDLLTADTAER